MFKFISILVIVYGVVKINASPDKNFEDCSAYEQCIVEKVVTNACKSSERCKLRKNNTTTFIFTVQPKFRATELTSSLIGWQENVRDENNPNFEYSPPDTCDDTPCRTRAFAAQNVQLEYAFSQKLPVGNYTVKWQLMDTEQELKACCLEFKIALVP